MAATAGEVAELKELFASPARSPGSPARESALPLTRIAKFGVADENRRLAEQGRMEKEARLRQREQEAAERLAKAHASKAAAQLTNERARQHKDLTREMNQSLVRAIRETEAEWQEERQMAFSNFRNEARARVLIANALDARLDAQEAAVDAEERRLATAGRIELMRQVEEVRQTNLLEKREKAADVRETTTKAVAEAQDAAAIAKKLAAEAKRTDSKTWARQKETNKEEQKLRAAIGKNTVRAREPQPALSRHVSPHPAVSRRTIFMLYPVLAERPRAQTQSLPSPRPPISHRTDDFPSSPSAIGSPLTQSLLAAVAAAAAAAASRGCARRRMRRVTASRSRKSR